MQTETIIEAIAVLKNAEISEEERLAIVKAMGSIQSPVLMEIKSLRRQLYWLVGTMTVAVLSLPDQFLLDLLKAAMK